MQSIQYPDECLTTSSVASVNLTSVSNDPQEREESGDRIRFVVYKGVIILEPAKSSLREFKGSVEPRERPENLEKARREAK